MVQIFAVANALSNLSEHHDQFELWLSVASTNGVDVTVNVQVYCDLLCHTIHGSHYCPNL